MLAHNPSAPRRTFRRGKRGGLGAKEIFMFRKFAMFSVVAVVGMGLAAMAAMPPAATPGDSATKPAMGMCAHCAMACCDPNSPAMCPCMANMMAATTAVEAAQKALTAGDTKTAAAELDKAAKSLAAIKENCAKCRGRAATAPAASMHH
jgi:hypothetical protein